MKLNSNSFLKLATLGVPALLLAQALQAATFSLNDGGVYTSGAGTTVTASWTDNTGSTSTDWIGLYGINDPISPATWWSYAGGTTGSMNIPVTTLNNSQLGTRWKVAYLNDDGYGFVPGTGFQNITVVPSTTITLTPDKTEYLTTESIAVAWTNNLGAVGTDWIGIYSDGSSPWTSGSLAWQYAGSQAGSVTFGSLALGTYDVYFMGADSTASTHMLKSGTFTVIPEPTTALLGAFGFGALAMRRRRR